MAAHSRKEVQDLIDEIIRAHNKWNELVQRDTAYKRDKVICCVSEESRKAYEEYNELREKLVNMVPLYSEEGDDDFVYDYADIMKARGYEIKIDDLNLGGKDNGQKI